jgi:hypothetical protein
MDPGRSPIVLLPQGDKNMAKPPETPPSSDVKGVTRDARAGTRLEKDNPDPGGQLNHADEQSAGRPDGGRQADEEPDEKGR